MSALTSCRVYGCRKEGVKAGGRIVAPLCPVHFESLVPKEKAAKWMSELFSTGDLPEFQRKINELLREARG